MKLYHLLPLFLCLTLVNCSDQKKTSPNIEQKQTQPDMHTSQNSLDWSGVYSGVLPCASCEGIDTSLELMDDQSYQLTMIYLGEEEPFKVEQAGSFSWNKEGNIITLDDKEEPNQYFVGEHYIAKLDIDGNRVTGELAEYYILSKEQTKTE